MKNIHKILLTGSLVSLIAAPAFGAGPLNLNPNDPDNFSRWAGGGANIPWNPDQGGLPGVMDAATVAAATAVWESVPTATATYSNNGALSVDIDATNFCGAPPAFPPTPPAIPGCPLLDNLFVGANVSDGLSPIVFDDDGSIFVLLFGPSGVLGFASPDTFDGNGVPIEGVSFLNGGATVSGGGGYPDADFFGVQVHEFGHYSGMAHTVVNGQNIGLGDQSGPTPNNTYGNAPGNQVETMYPFAITSGGQSTLHADEIGFFSTMYPAPGFFAGSATVSGTIYAPNGITPLTGVNVIARNVADPFVDAVSAISGDRGVTGEYTFNGLTPGEDYTVHVDQILAGGFSTPGITLPGPEEFYNAGESNNVTTPDPVTDSTTVATAAGATTSGIDIIFNLPAPGDPLLVGEDGSVELFMPFTYSICGQDFDSVFVNANGNLTFGAGDSDFTESDGEFLAGPPRIAALWDDLSPYNFFSGAQQGLVTFDYDMNSFSVIFEDVPEFISSGSNSFEITLSRASNNVDIEYGSISATDGLAGISCGGAITSRFETEDDLTALQAATDDGAGTGRINMKPQPARFERFTGDNDTSGESLLFNPTIDYNDSWAESKNPLKPRKIKLPFNSIPVTSYTEIEPAGADVDYFSFRASAGTTLVAEILSGGLDTVMGVWDPSGNLIALDDDGGSGLLSKIQVPLSESGNYTLAVSAFADFNFDGDGFSGGRYVLDIFSINGILLALGDDDSEEVSLGFDFPFNGSDYSSVWVNSNGNLTFGSGDSDFSESVAEFLSDQPRIAPLWDDLSPNNGGMVVVEFDSGEATVVFDSVPEFLNTGANTFMVTLRDDGSFSIEYGAISAGDGLSGTTEGGGAADPGPSDLSAGPFSASGTTYENAAGDLDATTVDFNP